MPSSSTVPRSRVSFNKFNTLEVKDLNGVWRSESEWLLPIKLEKSELVDIKKITRAPE